MPCTTEVVLDALRATIDEGLVSRYGAGRRCYRDIEAPESLQAEQTPCVWIEQHQQRVVEPGHMLEMDVTLWAKVAAGEFTTQSPVDDDTMGYSGGAQITPLLNEVAALLDSLLFDTATNWRTIPVTITHSSRAFYRGGGEGALEYPVTLNFPRLAAYQLGLL